MATIIDSPGQASLLIGTATADIIEGLDLDDTLRGRGGDDELFGGTGDDILEGGGGRDTLDGEEGDDQLFGEGGNDILIGSEGNDFLDGGSGNDLANYGRLGAAITLGGSGLVVKDGLGQDTIANIERIRGDKDFDNLIDGALNATGDAAFDINLGTESLSVVIKNGPTFNFRVQNFKNVRGTDNDDVIRGDSQDNTFFGSLGSDILDGTTAGFNTVDYSDLGVDITLATLGQILKNGGSQGTDTIGNQFNQQTIQKIIGATGQTNTIDGTAPDGTLGSFVIDLSMDKFIVDLPFTDIEFEVVGFDNVVGTQNDDDITGNANDNTFFGSTGNDTYNGFSTGGSSTSSTNNTVDYSGLDEAIIFKAGGVINKGSNGTDFLLFNASNEQTIQTVIGAAGQKNVIDGAPSSPMGSNARFEVDLGNNSQKAIFVNEVMFGGSTIPIGTVLDFTIENFVDVIGTSNNDSIIGDGEDNTFFGSAGDDTLDGAGGFNTVDYSALDDVITLKVNGIIDKGVNGTDQIGGPGFTQTIQKIVGASGQNNLIDGTGSVGSVSFTIDLNSDGLTVNNLFGSGTSATFEVVDFVDVVGTNGRDTIVGNSLNNDLQGAAGADIISGGDGDDTLRGQGGQDFLVGGNGNDNVNGGGAKDVLNGVGSEFGANDFDILRGGEGADTFVLGEQFGVKYYIGAGFANIVDFVSGVDKIQLAGALGQYSFGAGNTQIFANTNPGDLIAQTNVTFNTATDFIFV